jgi:hypothetical protein
LATLIWRISWRISAVTAGRPQRCFDFHRQYDLNPAAFGVGPMRELGGFDYSTAFAIGSVVALILGGIALLVVRHSTVRFEGQVRL